MKVLLVALPVVTAALGFGGGWFAHRRTHAQPAPIVASTAPQVLNEDTNHDGRPDRRTTRDPVSHRVLQVANDRNHDGSWDEIAYYGTDGRVDRIDHDDDFDGHFDRYDSITSSGRPLLTHYDADWDNIPERWIQRGAHGEVVSEWTDANEDLAPERYREFNPQGRLTEEGIDSDGDGLYEEQHFYNVAWGDRQPAIVEHDRNADGLFESREVYDRDGHVTMVQLDSNNDGERDVHQYLTLEGRIYKEGHDRDGDGLFEEWRFPILPSGIRIGHDDNEDHDIDRWDPPGAPPGWCAARCVTVAPAETPIP